jgi:NitT/TauT family transport system ATP-binding protein
VLILSSSPTVIREDLPIDLPDNRDQLHTRSAARFTELRSHVYAQIQAAKRGAPDLGAAAAVRPVTAR